MGKLFDALTTVKDAVKEVVISEIAEGVTFDALIERCDETVHETIDSRLIYTSDIVAMWTELGCPDPSDADKSDEIMPLMTFAVYEELRDNTDVGRIVTEYLINEHTILCDACAVAVVNDDYSEGADPEVLSMFTQALQGGRLVSCGAVETGLDTQCEACGEFTEFGTAGVFNVMSATSFSVDKLKLSL